MQGRTTFVIAHRLSTIRRADQILVVEAGPHRRARHPRIPLRRSAAATTISTPASTASKPTSSSPPAKAIRSKNQKLPKSDPALMYTMYMALHINNDAVERKIRDLAALTGETMTEAIGVAASERIARINPPAAAKPIPSYEEIKAMIRSYNLQPINEDLTDDEILGYGPDGIPE